MSNQFSQAKVYANAGLKLLKNSLVLAKIVDTEGIDKEFTSEKAGSKVGGKVYIKRPPEFLVRDGRVAQVQDVLQGEVEVSIDKYKGVDVEYTSLEQTLDVDKLLNSQVLKGAMSQLASQIDTDLQDELLEFPNWVGTPGQVITTPAQFFKAPQRLDELAIPMTDRNAVLSPADTYGLAGNLLVNAAQQGSIAKTALEKAKIPIIGSVDPYMTQTVPSLTCGSRNATAAMDGANQDKSFSEVRTNFQQEIDITGVGNAKTIKRGEVFTIADVKAVNPRTKAVLPYPAQFVVLEDAESDSGGKVTIKIANPIIASGAYQNVSAVPGASATITWLGTAGETYTQNAAFHKTALKLVSAKLIMPASGEASYATDPDTGLTIRYWRTSDGINDTHLHRWDVIYGCHNIDRRLGTRVSGAST